MEKIHQEQPITLNGSAFRNVEVCHALLIKRVSLRIKDNYSWKNTSLKDQGNSYTSCNLQKETFLIHIYIKYHQKLSNNSFKTSDPCRNPFLRMYSRFEKWLCKHIMILQRLCVGAEVFSSQAKEQDQLCRAPQAQSCCPQPQHLSITFRDGLSNMEQHSSSTNIRPII